MSRAEFAALLVGAIVVVLIVVFVRRRTLRVKFAGLWLLVGAAMGLLAVVPSLLDAAADLLDVADPPNLLFFVAILVLLGVILQLSVELSRVQEQIRTLAEEVAMLRLDRDLDSERRVTTHDADRVVRDRHGTTEDPES